MPYIIIGIIVVLILIWFISTYNTLVVWRNKVEEAFSTMDVYLKKRYDLIPNLVETVKGYAKHEQGTLEAVIKARNSALAAPTTADKVEAENQFSGALRQLFALQESYPELKANTNFLELQGDLRLMEGDIANSRKYYNGVCKEFNTKIELFPTNLIAGLLGFRKQPLFTVSDESERQNVKVSF